MLRFVHTSDWHLGKRLAGHSLLDDQAHALSEIETICATERAHALVIAGDVYDRSVPQVEAVELFSAFLERFTQKLGIPVVAISGNHDGVERLGFGAALLSRSGVHVRTRLHDRASAIDVTSPLGTTASFYTLPYLEPERARTELENEALKGHDASVRAALAAIHADRKARDAKNAVLVAHLFCIGGVATPDSERPLAVGDVGYVHPRSLGRFAYVALGHLHRAQRVAGREHVRYSGSLLKYSVAEHTDRKSVTVVDLEDGKIVSRAIPLRPKRDLVVVEGSFEELSRNAELARHADDYVAARYNDATYVLHAAERLRDRFPRLLEALPTGLVHDHEATRTLPRAGDTPRQLLSAFFRYIEPPHPLEEPQIEIFERACDRAMRESE